MTYDEIIEAKKMNPVLSGFEVTDLHPSLFDFQSYCTKLALKHGRVDMWQKIASPVWFDVNFGETLNLKGAKDEEDEAHICPLSLDTTGRATLLWSNPGDLCYTPYGGIGSEPCKWIEMGRNVISHELKESYFNVAIKNVKNYEKGKMQLVMSL